MKAPLRHEASPRNRAKALKFARDLEEELDYIANKLCRLDGHLRYARGRVARLTNRLKAEMVRDK